MCDRTYRTDVVCQSHTPGVKGGMDCYCESVAYSMGRDVTDYNVPSATRLEGDRPHSTPALEPWSYQTVCFNKSARGGTWGQAASYSSAT